MRKEKILLAIDQSSKCTGWSIYHNGILEKYGKFSFTNADSMDRILNLKKAIDKLIEEEEINHVVIEEIQLQVSSNNNVATFKVLAFVMATILLLCKEKGLPCQTIASSTWKSVCGVKGKIRAEQKQDAQRFVMEEFGIKAIQDIVDSICLGYCASKQDRNQVNWG